ncbi:hypothetical protein [Butyrivibrio sp. LB2008]|uniref:hypothetical protein n=1 Tax=Butyrivibrio sp. LB2008 TaxID=1408305 RepID=UPI00047C0425
MSKSKGKYAPQKVGDNMIIPSKKYEGLFLVSIIIAVIYAVALVDFLKGYDSPRTLYLLELLAVLIAFLGWVYEKTVYVIAPAHIEIKYGPFRRKIQLDQISSYSSNTSNTVFLYLVGGKEICIEYKNLDRKAKGYFNGMIERNNIPEKEYSDCHNFKMHVKGSFFILVTCISILIFFNYGIFGLLISYTYTICEMLPEIIGLLFMDALFLFWAFSSAYTVKVHDKCIDIKNFGIPVKNINVDDISYFKTCYVTRRCKQGVSRFEELTIVMKNEKLGFLFPTISSDYSNYETLIGYLKANVISSYNSQKTNSQKSPNKKQKKKNKKKK